MSKRSFTLNSKVVNQFILFDLDPKRQTQKQGNKPNDPRVHFHFKFLWRQLFQLPLARMLLYLCTCGQLSVSRLCKHFEIIWSSPAKQGNYKWDSKFSKFTAGYSFKVVHFFLWTHKWCHEYPNGTWQKKKDSPTLEQGSEGFTSYTRPKALLLVPPATWGSTRVSWVSIPSKR